MPPRGRRRLFRPPAESENLSEVGKRLGAVIEEVCPGCTSRRLARKALGLPKLASASQELRPHAPPADVLVGDAGRRASFGKFGQPKSLLVVPSVVESVGELWRDRREVAPVSHPLKRLARRSQRALGSGSVPSEQLDVPGLGCHTPGQDDFEAKLLRQRLRPRDQVTGGVEAPQHRLKLRSRP